MATIDLVDLKKVYPGNVTAVHHLNLAIGDGELLVLVGPSGCGKSTLLRMIAGLETITEGTISIAGRVVNKEEPAQRDIAMVFQNYALYPHMSVFDNMAYGLKIRRLPRPEIRQRVGEAAAILQIEPLLDRLPRQLSGGQRQRVAMGRAIVRNPSVFLFDEPLSNLDAKLRVEMRIEIRKLHNTLKTTSVYVTHDQVEAMTLADRIVLMNAGVAEQIGTPMDLYEAPRTMFVAGFIGSPPMNLIEAEVAEDGASLVLAGGAPLKLNTPLASDWNGRPVFVGVRPEKLRLDDPGADLSLSLGIELVERHGADSVLHGILPNRKRGEILVRLIESPIVPQAERIDVKLRQADIHLFDAQSGASLEWQGRQSG